MNFLTYVARLLVHNFNVLMVTLLQVPYRLIDQLKCEWYVFLKRGSTADYHLMMLKNSGIGKEFANREHQMFFVVMDIVKQLELPKVEADNILAHFHPMWGCMQFTADIEFFMWTQRLSKVKKGEDIFNAMNTMGMVSRQDLMEKIEPAMFHQLRNADIKQMRTLLSPVPGMQLK
jgi:hypothetical protein